MSTEQNSRPLTPNQISAVWPYNVVAMRHTTGLGRYNSLSEESLRMQADWEEHRGGGPLTIAMLRSAADRLLGDSHDQV